MDIVEMVLTGRVNKGLVSMIQGAGGSAVGLCGKDSNLLEARMLVEKDIGYVGEVTQVWRHATCQACAYDGCTHTLAHAPCLPAVCLTRHATR